MTRTPSTARQMGFTLIEMLTAMGIFLLICGAAFTLLGTSQQRYRTESQVLNSFQEARLGLDQIVRDVHDAGFPPPAYSARGFAFYASSPFAWSTGSGYPNTPCQIAAGGGGTCTTGTPGDTAPGDNDLIIETNPNPQDPASTVQWIRYQLQGTTLLRGVAAKQFGHDPDADTTAQLVPFVQNVVNTASAVPIFTYTCETPTVPQLPLPLCSAAGADNSPANIRDINITLLVATPLPDATTGKPRVVTLSGRGRRVNPNQ